MIRYIKIQKHERGLLFREGDLVAVLGPGAHWFLDPLLKLRLDRVTPREPWLKHKDLDVIAKSGKLAGEAEVIDLRDYERALVWIDGRFNRILEPGLYVLWTTHCKVRIEIIDAREARLERNDLAVIVGSIGSSLHLETFTVEAGHIGLYVRDGVHRGTLEPGSYAFWKGVGRLRLCSVDLREQMIDISGQQIMTADKVTLRLNAVLTYRIEDPLRSVTVVEDARQALYRDAQLGLREVVGARELDALLTAKDAVARELEQVTRARAAALGVAVVSLGIRDVILPGEMKELLNRVTEARKAAEASLITRREETAAMRMQANTAKILEPNPTLMKLRELEVLEKVADKANLTVVLGEGGLADKVVKLL